MREYQALISLSQDSYEPDRFTLRFDHNKKPIPPPNNFVISRKKNGETLSYYGDDEFDLSPYSNRVKGGKRIKFKEWSKDCNKDKDVEILITEYKWLFFNLLYFSINGRAGHLSVSTLYEYSLLLRLLCKFAYEQRITTSKLLSELHLIKKFINSGISIKSIKILGLFLDHLLNIGYKKTGLHVLSKEKTLNIKEIAKSRRANADKKQTPVIPSRIYLQILIQLHSFTDDYLVVKDEIYRVLKKVSESKKKIKLKNSSSLSNLCESCKSDNTFDLDAYSIKYNIKNLGNLFSNLIYLQYCFKYLIHAYTGMRDNEVLSLQYNCLKKETTESGRVLRLIGETTKFTGTSKLVYWVTSEDTEKAVKAAQSIVDIIEKFSSIEADKCPLFLSLTYLPFFRNRTPNPTGRYSITNFYSPNLAFYKTIFIDLRIQENDLKELEEIDPFRNWRNEEKFQIGGSWPLSTHQLRRSLVVYSLQSSLISLPALKQQLKHISPEMSLYYAKGSSYAKKYFGHEPNIFHEYHTYKPEADALNYFNEIILSPEKLGGAHGAWVEKHQKTKEKITLLKKRQDTIDLFNKGLSAYTKTPLGGCMSVDPCDKKPLRALTACISCPKAVVKKSNLEVVIVAQQNLVNKLDKNTMEFKSEMEQLIDLKRLQADF